MDVISYKCPNCGGHLQFDPASGKYTCEWCNSVFTQEDIDAQTEKAEKTGGQQTSSAYEGMQGEGKVYTCPSCGAVIMTDDTTAATFCYYCHSAVVLSGRLSGEDKPDYVIPFKIDKKKALEIFEKWIGQHKYIPSAFYSKEQIEKFSGVYFPYYMYSCKVKADLDIKADKTKVHTESGTEYTETETYQIKRSGSMEISNIFRNALGKANRVLADCVQPFTPEGMVPFNMSYLTGFMAEKKDLDASQYDAEIEKEVTEYAVSSIEGSLKDYKNVEVTPDNVEITGGTWEYALMPVWTLTYQADGKTYYFSINGQTGKTVGELPVDQKKLVLSTLKFVIPAIIALLAIFYFIF